MSCTSRHSWVEGKGERKGEECACRLIDRSVITEDRGYVHPRTYVRYFPFILRGDGDGGDDGGGGLLPVTRIRRYYRVNTNGNPRTCPWRINFRGTGNGHLYLSWKLFDSLNRARSAESAIGVIALFPRARAEDQAFNGLWLTLPPGRR